MGLGTEKDPLRFLRLDRVAGRWSLGPCVSGPLLGHRNHQTSYQSQGEKLRTGIMSLCHSLMAKVATRQTTFKGTRWTTHRS